MEENYINEAKNASDDSINAINDFNTGNYNQTVTIALVSDVCSESAIEKLCVRIYQLLGKYDINYSKAYLLYDVYSYNKAIDHKADMKAEYHTNFTYIAKKDEPYHNAFDFSVEHELRIYIDEPKFNDVLDVMSFIIDLCKLAYPTTDEIVTIDNINFSDSVDKFFFEHAHPDHNLFIRFDSREETAFDVLSNAIEWFFGPATADKLDNYMYYDNKYWYLPEQGDEPIRKKHNSFIIKRGRHQQ